MYCILTYTNYNSDEHKCLWLQHHDIHHLQGKATWNCSIFRHLHIVCCGRDPGLVDQTAILWIEGRLPGGESLDLQLDLPIKNNQCILAQVSASFSKCLMFCKTCSVKKWLTTLRSVKQRPLVSSMKWGIEGRKTDLVQPKSWAVILPVHSDPDTFTRSVIMNNGQLGHVSTVTAWDHKSTSIDPSIQQSWGSAPSIQHVAVPAANVPHFRHQHELQLNGIKRPKITRPLGHWIAVFEHEVNRFRFSVPKIFGDADSDAPWHFSESVLRKPCILGSAGQCFWEILVMNGAKGRANHL